jgi:nitrogen fixation/metabolism regulation signal transduction histidine kinase
MTALLALLWAGDYSNKLRWTLVLVCGLTWLMVSLSLRNLVARPLEVLANLLMAIREGDFSLRGHPGGQGAFGEAVAEVNTLATVLRERRLEEAEAAALLSRIMEDVDVALFAWDASRHLRLVNRAGALLLGKPAEALIGQTAEGLGLTPLVEGEAVRGLELAVPGGRGPWELRRGSFRQGGKPHELVVLTDVRRALREEEREAWKRLIRVLGHEINNTLAPIQSLAGSLQAILSRQERAADWEKDLSQGLAVIGRRAESLGRFMTSYTQLARLPPPVLGQVEVSGWVTRCVAMERRLEIKVTPGPELTLRADGDQLEQLLINLLRNAADAALEALGGVEVGWTKKGSTCELWIRDEGLGIANPDNLFVPFFTTKPGGSGVGLALARQIAEMHGGKLQLGNRVDRRGCEALLTLPLIG